MTSRATRIRLRQELLSDFVRLNFNLQAVAGFRGLSVDALRARMRDYRLGARTLRETREMRDAAVKS